MNMEYTDIKIEKMFDNLSNIAFNEGEEFCDTWSNCDGCNLYLAEDFEIWTKGTARDDIWRWFDNNHSKGIAYLLYER